jgi:ribosomal protein S18 acetylase RimI-like enzyme
MSGVSYREMIQDELPRLAEIDRSEIIRVGFRIEGGELTEIPVEWDSPDFFKEGDGEHSVARQVEFCSRHVAAGARIIGAFDLGRLVGIGLLTPEIRPGMAQLAYLHVSRSHRRRGVGRSITRRLLGFARDVGSREVYVSATPSQSAVGFYRSFGFGPVSGPIPELYALEPDDIHMTLRLDRAR